MARPTIWPSLPKAGAPCVNAPAGICGGGCRATGIPTAISKGFSGAVLGQRYSAAGRICAHPSRETWARCPGSTGSQAFTLSGRPLQTHSAIRFPLTVWKPAVQLRRSQVHAARLARGKSLRCLTGSTMGLMFGSKVVSDTVLVHRQSCDASSAERLPDRVMADWRVCVAAGPWQ